MVTIVPEKYFRSVAKVKNLMHNSGNALVALRRAAVAFAADVKGAIFL
jgi:hypothetical protein